MLFTRTIRRKLLVGAGLVLVMLLIASISGISGLNSYRNVIRDLDYDINQAPQGKDLVAGAAALFEPLRWAVKTEDPAGIAFQRREIERRLGKLRDRVLEFRRRMEELPPAHVSVQQRPVTEALLLPIDQKLSEMEGEFGALEDLPARDKALRRLLDKAADVQTLALLVPDPVEGLSRSLEHARRVYRSSLVIVWITSSVALTLFVGLVRYGYIVIFDPIRKLHQGALRVAHGDFQYRVKLKTRDEMAELAEAFNRMTARFREIAGDLDRQVQERSRQLVRSERLAGIGFLAAGVAHEINNPLSAIAMAAESLEGRVAALLEQLDPADASVIPQYLRMIQNESFRCREITERLLDFSRGREAVREPTDLARLICEVIAMVRHLSKYREKKIDFERPDPCFAEVNASEIKQVVLNLVANGLDAMERGGTLRIRLVEQTDHVVLEFEDEGCGLSPEVMENMFEPFFTSKQHGQGTGLGLSISHRIISQHGGTISASSPGAGQGSTFSVRLPRRAAGGSSAAA